MSYYPGTEPYPADAKRDKKARQAAAAQQAARTALIKTGQLASQVPTVLSYGRDLLGQLNQPGTLELRVGDAEREQVAALLGEHYAAGRLSYEEYDARLQAAMTATTRGDLVPLLRDLPGQQVALVPPRQVIKPKPPRYQPSVPAVPVLLVLLGVFWLTGAPWLFWMGLGAYLLWRHQEKRRQLAQLAQLPPPPSIQPPLFR